MSEPSSDKNIEIYLPKPHNESNQSNQPKLTPSPFIGLFNYGNTCYLNSLLQTLFMTPIFRNEMLKWTYNETIHASKKDCIPYQLQKLFARLQLKKRKAEETNKLTSSFQWSNNELAEQNDIQELIHVLFAAINENFINDIFQGEMTSIIKCNECQNLSEKNENFIDLSLPVKNNKKSIDSLEKSFNFILQSEKMTGDNMYKCEKCNKKVEAEHYYIYKKLPKILLLTLNRFEYDFSYNCKKKINSKFTFPFELNTEDIMKISPENDDIKYYHLYSIIVHSGSSRGGHYYSVVKSYQDSKWYKFDDYNVYEIDINTIIETLYGNNQNDTSAYILLYSMDNQQYEFDIKKELNDEIEAEEVEYQHFLEEERERMSWLDLRVYCWEVGNKIENIKMQKDQTVGEMKEKIIEVLKIKNDFDDTRIRVMDSNNRKVIAILESEYMTLEECNVNQNKIYNLEVREKGGKFSEFNPNEIIINVVVWDDKFKESNDISRDIDKSSYKLKIDKNISYDKFNTVIIEQFKDKIDYNNYNIITMKKQDYGVSNFNMVTFKGNESEIFFADNMKVYIETINKDKSKENEPSKFQTLFESMISNVKVIFNEPLDMSKLSKKITVKSYKFNHSVEIHPKKTIGNLKKVISEIIKVQEDEFIMKKNSHNGVEIKKLTDLIEKYTSKCLTLFIQYGVPVKENDIKINIQQYLIDLDNFALFPYKIIDLGSFKIDKTWNIIQVKEFIETKVSKLQKGKEGGNLYIRREKNFKPGNFYDDNIQILSTDIKENSTIICQYINKKYIYKDEFVDKGNSIQFAIRIWSPSEWKMTLPIEVIINKATIVDNFTKGILFKIISDFSNKSINCSDLYGVKIYNNEMNFYIDEVDKMEFYSFDEYNSSLIVNFPFLINNEGCMLLIKDTSNPPREPTDEEKKYYYKKTDKKTTVKKNTVGKKKEKIINPIVKKDRYKEKAMVIKAKQKDIGEVVEKDNNTINSEEELSKQKGDNKQ